MTSVKQTMLDKLTQNGVYIVFTPETPDVMQAISIADKPYELMDPTDYSDLCLIIQCCVTLQYSKEKILDIMGEWEACDGPHFDEPEGAPLFIEHVLAILSII